MRKLMTNVGLGLALTVGTASAVAAQQTRPDTARREKAERGDRGDRGERRRGGPDAALLKGITLTDAQKTQLTTMREAQRSEMQKNREQFSAAMKEARAAREKGDTATARAKMTAVRTQMTQQRDRQIAALRTILTAEQQKQFDANVAVWKERGQRGMRGDREGHQGHGARGRQKR
jgi:protein CpxP